jgi:ankyrin repeat protein
VAAGAPGTGRHWRATLHWAAAQNPSIEVARIVLDAWPQALQAEGSGGWLPLHLAAGLGQGLDVLEFVSYSWPQALMVKSDDGLLPLHCAAQYNPSWMC